MGFESYGLEPAESYVQYAREKGLRVFAGSFPERIPEELLQKRFRIVSMIEMMYYLCDLKKSLLKVRDMLEANGLFLVQCHQGHSRCYSLNLSYFRRYGDHVQGIPTLHSLMHCLTKTGFKPVKLFGFNIDENNNISIPKSYEETAVADRLLVLAEKTVL